MTETKRHSGYFLVGNGKQVLLFHRHAASDSTRLFVSTSLDGTTFTPKRITGDFSKIGWKGKPFGNATSFRAGQLGKKLFLSFFDQDEDALEILFSDSGAEWASAVKKSGLGHPTVLVETNSDRYHAIAVFSSGKRKCITLSLTDAKFQKWNDRGVVLEARPKSFDTSALSPLSAIRTKQDIVLVYSAKNSDGHITVGAAIFDAKQPERLLWRSISPIWTAPSDWIDAKVTILGGTNVGKYFYVYFQRKDGVIETFPMSRLWETYRPPSSVKKTKGKSTLKKKLASIVHPKIPASVAHRLCRHEENPILEPLDENAWEAFSAFNAAAVLLDEKVHLLYRAQGHDGISILGYAMTEDGIHITKRSPDPVFVPSNPFDTRKKGTPRHSYPYVSGGGWGGCEDPRLTKIGGRIYMTYVAFNGAAPPGVALTSIRTSDFGKRWRWTEPRLISRPGHTRKNWVVFPEKIRGKFAILHIISPLIGVDYVDSLDDPDLVIDSTNRCYPTIIT
jgi:predicted GH43/DUF377 family glycosyl hydrolase